jgi:hypothetical protein
MKNSTSNTSAVYSLCSILLTLMVGFASFPAHAVLIDGRDWRQPIESKNLSYNHLAAVCDVNTGVCNGEAINIGQPNVDLTGWIWASIDDVARLFERVTGQVSGSFYESTEFRDSARSAWVASAIDVDGNGVDFGLFQATRIAVDQDFGVYGLTRSLFDNTSAHRAYFRDTSGGSQAILKNGVLLSAARQENGHWLYRDIPVPGTVLLISIGLALLPARFARRCTSRI